MELIGVGMVMRKLANNAKPSVEFKSGDEWLFRTISSVKTTDVKFKLGSPFDDTSLDGSECQVSNFEVIIYMGIKIAL